MGRKAKLTQTVLKFIARDDSALGVEEARKKEAYEAFLTEQDIKGLQVDESEEPAWYRLRPFRAENWGEVVDAYAAVTKATRGDKDDEDKAEVAEGEQAPAEAKAEAKTEAEVKPPTPDELKDLMRTHRHHVREAVRDRIVGALRHPVILGVDDTGTPDIRLVTWEVGTPEPEGLVEDILSQDALVLDMFMYLLYAAMLTERKKKL